ncbi:phosphotransferase enzyme family protein [Sorangium sp. So ce1335]|uniref:phosphotransferase enzyme family protein n=1 Tax=Sorangium sp. So ce1335 TaxID=3133335 RepID=UPI003F62E6F3
MVWFDMPSPDEQDRRMQMLAEAALPRWGLVADSITLIQHEDNAVFCVTAGGQRWALRVGAANGWSVQEQRAEMDWLTDLRRAGLSVPDPTVSLSGDTVEAVDLPDLVEARPCVLLRWVPGDPPEPGVPVEVARRIGALAAELHQRGEVFASARDVARPEWGFETLFGPGSVFARTELWEVAIGHHGQQRIGAAIARLERRFSSDGARPGAWGLIHGDLHRDNILVQDGAVGLIDFDDCGTGPSLLDLAAVVESFCRRLARSEGDRTLLRAALLEGYHHLRPLPDDVDAALRDYIAVRLLTTLGFIVSSTNPAVRSWGPARIPQILEQIDRFVAQDPAASA